MKWWSADRDAGGCVIDLPPDAVNDWFADGMSDDPDQRLADVLLIGPRVGACDDCGALRVRAELELWQEVTSAEDLTDLATDQDPDPGPFCERILLCEEHVAERRSWEPDPQSRIVMIRTICLTARQTT